MSNPKCSVCGNINRIGAQVCEMCDARLDDSGVGGEPNHAYSGQSNRRDSALPTDIPSPPFKGAGDVISPTLEIYRKNFLLVGLLVLVSTVPIALLHYALFFLFLPGNTVLGDSDDQPITTIAGGGTVGVAMGGALLEGIVSLLGNALLAGALVYGVIELRRTGEAKVGDCLRWGIRMLPVVFLVSLGYTIITTAGFFLLIIPGILFSLMFSLVVPVAAAEGRGVIDSFKRSAELTKGYRGLIFVTFFLWGILIFVVTIVVTGSFLFGGAQGELPFMFLQTLITQMLQSSSIVLTVFIFLGILNEEKQGFENRIFTSAGAGREDR